MGKSRGENCFGGDMNSATKGLFAGIILLMFTAPLGAEWIFLRDGSIVSGEIMRRGEKGMLLRLEEGVLLFLSGVDILRVRKDDSFLDEKEIRLKGLRTVTGYVVARDDYAITVRRSLLSTREMRYPTKDVVKIHEAGTRGKLRPAELAKKRDGHYFTGFPFVAFNTDNGVIFGGRGYFYQNGRSSDPFFDREPYSLQAYLHLYFSSSGYMLHRLNLDAYHLGGTPLRLTTALEYEHNINANYFGIGRDVVEEGLTDINGKHYGRYKDYRDNFLLAGDKSHYKYNNVQYLAPRYYLNLSGTFFRYLKLLIGFEVNYVFIRPWDNRTFKHKCKEYTAASQTRISLEKPTGYEGGWTNFVRFGIAFDTRDYPPDPHEGVFTDFTIESSGRMIGSDYEYHRFTLGARFYVPIIESLVYATRIGFTTAIGDIPFYEMSIFPFIFERSEGLKHNSHMRGYKFARFVANTQLMINLELRWKFIEFYHKKSKNRFSFQLVPFVDIKNVWDNFGQVFVDHRFRNYRFSYGGSIIIAWNLATVMRLSFGFSPEDFAISMSFGQSF